MRVNPFFGRMNQTELSMYTTNATTINFNRLPRALRESAAESKYAVAVAMYASSKMSLREVAKECGVTAAGLSAHISKHHRCALFERYGLDPDKHDVWSMKVKPPKGQSLKTHLKYKDAIEACGDIAYIEYNVAQIARLFNLRGPSLAYQLYTHYPDVIPNRENARRQLGIADNTPRGARDISKETYREAVEMYRDTDMTIPEVAEACSVSQSGLSRYMRAYHKDIIAEKADRRKAAKKASALRRTGELSGNGTLYGPKPSTVELYSKALELYHTTDMTVEEIIVATKVPADGFKGYLYQWHRTDRRPPINSASGKYAPAIRSLMENPRDITKVAAEFGLNPDVFRVYLKSHEPELANAQGMMRLPGGNLVKRASYEKYKDAIDEYATSAEDLKSIAARHGLAYNSIMGFVTRNCPAERESHQRLLETARNNPAHGSVDKESLK